MTMGVTVLVISSLLLLVSVIADDGLLRHQILAVAAGLIAGAAVLFGLSHEWLLMSIAIINMIYVMYLANQTLKLHIEHLTRETKG